MPLQYAPLTESGILVLLLMVLNEFNRYSDLYSFRIYKNIIQAYGTDETIHN